MVSDRPRQPKLDWVLRVKRELDVDGMNHLVNNLIGGDMVSDAYRVESFSFGSDTPKKPSSQQPYWGRHGFGRVPRRKFFFRQRHAKKTI